MRRYCRWAESAGEFQIADATIITRGVVVAWREAEYSQLAARKPGSPLDEAHALW